jgi:tetratricopeptide (TPR) repeat protein
MTVIWNRRVVPQWSRSTDPETRFLRNAASNKSLSPLKITTSELSELSKAIADFKSDPSIGVAADAMRFGLRQRGNVDLSKVAEFILSSDAPIPEGLKQLATATLKGDIADLHLSDALDLGKPLNSAIHDSRKWLARFPRDSLSWLDLGRLHAAAGNIDSAKKAVQSSLALGPNNRIVLRGASRFFLHARDPEAALAVLDKSPRTSSDPWLMAGHIAINSILDKTSRLIKKSKQLITVDSLPHRDIAELAGSLATLELDAGSNKGARKLFNISLREPNENALAQVEWAVKHLNVVPDLPQEWLDSPVSSEAGYYHSIFNNNFEEALIKALRWHSDEPFASRPLQAASFIAAVSGKLEAAATYARQGLVTEPENIELLNNLAFSLGAGGDISSAESLIQRASSLEKEKLGAHTFANLGMLAYLKGEHSNAELLYAKSIEAYKRLRQLEEASIAASFRAHFAKKAHAANWQALSLVAKAAAEDTRSGLALEIFQRSMNERAEDTTAEKKVALPRRWSYDKNSNVLVFENHFPLGKN